AFKEIDITEGCRCPVEQVPESGLTLHIRDEPQIVAVEIEKVECLVDNAIGIALPKLAPQRMEISNAAARQHHRLAVEDCLVRFHVRRSRFSRSAAASGSSRLLPCFLIRSWACCRVRPCFLPE